jgi:Uncharacterised nucleotidyltransferase
MAGDAVSSATDDVLAACAAYGLPTARRFPHGPLSAEAFSKLLVQAEHHRLVGFLGAAARDGALIVDVDQHDALEQVLEGWLAHSLRVEALVLATTEALDTAGVPYRVFKGVALANTVYADPALRVFADVDVLAPSAQFGRAAQVLESSLGAGRALPEPRSGFDARFGREAMLRSDKGLELDIHRTFVDGGFGLTVDLDELFSSPRTFTLGQRDVSTLPTAHQFVSSCYAAALGDWPPRLASQRDVIQLLEVERPSAVDVLDIARRWRAEAVVAQALCAAWDAIEPRFTPPLVEWARRYRPKPIDRLLLASYRGPARGLSSKAAAVLVLPGIADKVLYLRAMALPQRGYLEKRGLTTGSHWRRALTLLRRR